MRRNRLRVLFLLLPVILLMSCNGKFGAIIPDYSIYDQGTPVNAQLILQHNFSSEALAGFKAITNRFNDENEWNIKINLSTDPDGVADIRIVEPSAAVRLLKQEQSIELSPLMYHPLWGWENRRGDFYKAARKQTDYWDFSRKITSIPLSLNAEVLLVNNDILNQAGFSDFPGSWPVMNYLFWKIKRNTDAAGLGMDYNAGSVISFINARGGSVLKPNGLSYSLNNPVVNRAIRYLREKSADSVFSVNTTDYLNQTEFAFGKLLSVYTGADGIKYYNSMITAAAPEMDWSTALLPTRRLGKGVTVNCETAAITSDNTDKQIAAWLFIRWITSVEAQLELASATGSFPSSIKASEIILDSPSARAEVALPRQWIEALELFHNSHMEVLPNLSDYSEVSGKFESVIDECLSGKTIWLETWKLNRDVRKTRRNRNKTEAEIQ